MTYSIYLPFGYLNSNFSLPLLGKLPSGVPLYGVCGFKGQRSLSPTQRESMRSCSAIFDSWIKFSCCLLSYFHDDKDGPCGTVSSSVYARMRFQVRYRRSLGESIFEPSITFTCSSTCSQ